MKQRDDSSDLPPGAIPAEAILPVAGDINEKSTLHREQMRPTPAPPQKPARKDWLMGAVVLLLFLGGYFWLTHKPEPPPPKLPSAADVEFFIRNNLRHEAGMFVVREPLLKTLSVLPASTTWAVRCGRLEGLKVQFGSSGENSPELRITWLGIPEDACVDLASVAARTITQIVAGQ